ncbi:hypothetical protein Taro_037933 [Colocasia esculenta]|uniref:Uncharacterized protein n=1 Tax=Colocasia esculenta TaxID=4460 RepID=A0A843WCF4_COLES|nr:hypothetical protein [Colocasia esculenta]
MTERLGSCRLHAPVERDPHLFYETTCALLGPAFGRPLQVLGLSNNGKNPCTCRDMAESPGRSRYDRKSREVKIRPEIPGRSRNDCKAP